MSKAQKPADPKKSRRLARVLAGALGAIVLAIGGLFGAGLYFGRHPAPAGKSGKAAPAHHNQSAVAPAGKTVQSPGPPAAWIPNYPGAKVEGSFAPQTGVGVQMRLSTTDPPGKVVAHYLSALKAGGFTVGESVINQNGGMIASGDGARSVTLTINGESGHTTIVAIYGLTK